MAYKVQWSYSNMLNVEFIEVTYNYTNCLPSFDTLIH